MTELRWLKISLLILLLSLFHFWFFSVWPAEWVHREERDVCRCGLYEPGQRSSWWATLPIPGCWAGWQHCSHHLPGSFGMSLTQRLSMRSFFVQNWRCCSEIAFAGLSAGMWLSPWQLVSEQDVRYFSFGYVFALFDVCSYRGLFWS